MVLPISNDKLKQLQSETQKDPVLQKLKNVILNSWPRYKSNLHPTVQVYWDYQEELTVQNELIFKRDKIVIPTALRADMLKAVHQPHLGGETSKRRAREVLFWPSIDRDIEKMVKSCSVCNRNRNQQPRETLKIQPVPNRPWQRIGVDLFTFHQRNYLITVDFYSGWFEIDLLSGIVASAVISKLKS